MKNQMRVKTIIEGVRKEKTQATREEKGNRRRESASNKDSQR